MPTLKEYAREMILREPALGSIHAITALATGSATVAQLATGSVSANHYKGQWMTRRDTTTAADRKRIITDFTNSSGLFAHTGANYGDTTVNSELLEITEHDPYQIDRAIGLAVRRLRHLDTEIIPARGADRYWLTDLPWIKSPSDIKRVYHSSLPVLSRNRHMDKWYTVGTDGVLSPDNWTISGSGFTYSRIAGVHRGAYSLRTTRAGTDGLVTQNLDLLDNMITGESLRGRTVTAFLVGKTAVASQLMVSISDGVTTSDSGFLATGAANAVTVSKVLSSAAASLSVFATSKQNGIGDIADLGLIYGADPNAALREILSRSEDLPIKFDTSAPVPQLITPVNGFGSQIVIESYRPYPGFDATRLQAGSADADSQDAPLEIIAELALWILYRSLERNARNIELANVHRVAYEEMQGDFLYVDEDNDSGLPLLVPVPRGNIRRL